MLLDHSVFVPPRTLGDSFHSAGTGDDGSAGSSTHIDLRGLPGQRGHPTPTLPNVRGSGSEGLTEAPQGTCPRPHRQPEPDPPQAADRPALAAATAASPCGPAQPGPAPRRAGGAIVTGGGRAAPGAGRRALPEGGDGGGMAGAGAPPLRGSRPRPPQMALPSPAPLCEAHSERRLRGGARCVSCRRRPNPAWPGRAEPSRAEPSPGDSGWPFQRLGAPLPPGGARGARRLSPPPPVVPPQGPRCGGRPKYTSTKPKQINNNNNNF